MGLHNGALKIRVKAPPVDGKANKEVIEFLSKYLGLPKNKFAIKSGQTSKNKLIEINTDDESKLRDLLGLS